MVTTFSVKLSNPDQKQTLNDVLSKIAERYPQCNKKGDSLIKLCELYVTGFTESVYREIPPSVRETLNDVDCSYLRYEGEALGFFCFELFHLKKEGKAIGTQHDKVISRCNLCRLGKHDKEQYKIHEQLRKKNIKNILELRDILIKLTHESTLAQLYICKGELFDNHKLIISADGIHLQCPLELDDKNKPMEMSVIEHCYEQINPYDMNPPCKHLIDPYVRVRPPDRAEEILDELKQLENQPQQDIKTEAKNIDVEVIESEEDEEKKENE